MRGSSPLAKSQHRRDSGTSKPGPPVFAGSAEFGGAFGACKAIADDEDGVPAEEEEEEEEEDAFDANGLTSNVSLSGSNLPKRKARRDSGTTKPAHQDTGRSKSILLVFTENLLEVTGGLRPPPPTFYLC